MDEIRLVGLRLVGTHGALDEERTRAQPFEVDITLRLDLSPAAASDSLDDTVDYGVVVAGVAAIVEAEQHRLLERLAERIAESVLGIDPRLAEVVVTVSKLRPPVPFDLARCAVQVTRVRPE